MKISQKLILGFVIVAFLSGVVGYVGLMTFRNVGETFAKLKGDIVPGAIKMTEMQASVDRVYLYLEEYLTEGEAESKKEMEAAIQELLKGGKEHYEHEINIGDEERIDAQQFLNEIVTLNSLATQTVNARDRQVSVKEKLELVIYVLTEQIKEYKATHLQELAALTEMQELAAKIGYLTTVYVMGGIEEEKEEVEEVKKELRATQRELVKVGDGHLEREVNVGAEEKKAAEKLNAKIAAVNFASDELITLKDQELTQREEFYPVYEVLIKHLVGHKQECIQELDDATAAVSQVQATGTKLIIIISLIIIVLAIIIGFLISRAISAPIIKLKEAAVEIGKGNLDTEVEIKSNDEIGVLGDSFNKMVADLKVTRAKLESYSKELERQVKKRTKELEQAKVGLEKTVGEGTKELKARLEELERFRKATIDREFRMKELQEEIERLKAQKKT
ncbi:HAMP domain-containing protein [bacterium]|nr:HAMP domain-containing protein [bacterium]